MHECIMLYMYQTCGMHFGLNYILFMTEHEQG